jgi:hypothetical protein
MITPPPPWSSQRLIAKVVSFLNFKSSSHSGNALPKDGSFAELSPALRREIRVAMYRPALMRVRLFGRAPQDVKHMALMRKLFEEIDEDNSQTLNEHEIRQLMEVRRPRRPFWRPL